MDMVKSLRARRPVGVSLAYLAMCQLALAGPLASVARPKRTTLPGLRPRSGTSS
jgi:hypothetical protein